MVSYQDVEEVILALRGPSGKSVWWVDIRVELGRQALTDSNESHSREECALAVDSDQLRHVLREALKDGRLTQERGLFKVVDGETPER